MDKIYSVNGPVVKVADTKSFAMPVMEGKCVLFKEFGNVNAVPICLDTQDTVDGHTWSHV